jgi:hypothetical protein
VLYKLFDLAADELRNIENGAQRTRREQRVARAGQTLERLRVLAAESAYERRLASAGFPADEHQSAASAAQDRGQMLAECRQVTRAFKQRARSNRDGRCVHG